MTWQEIKARLLADKGNWAHIARETGLHVNGVRKLALGETASPRIDTVEKLAAYYARVTIKSAPSVAPAAREAA